MQASPKTAAFFFAQPHGRVVVGRGVSQHQAKKVSVKPFQRLASLVAELLSLSCCERNPLAACFLVGIPSKNFLVGVDT